MTYDLIRVADRPQLLEQAARWFHEKWGAPVEAYRDSMSESLSAAAVPQWYVAVAGERIIGGLGVIDNDFHDRKDLAPNVCAVFVEEDARGQGVAGRLLELVSRDMQERGVGTLYLLTNHTGFYERYGWRFLCMAQGDGEAELSRIYVRHADGQA